MKKFAVLALALCVLALALTACSEAPASSSSAPASSSVAQAAPVSESAAPETSAPPAPGIDLEALLPALSEAAGLGGTIPVSGELYLTSSGIDVANIVAYTGVESQLAAENGGIVLVFETAPGGADALKTQLESFRDAKVADDRYAEFEQARTNTGQARIQSKDDLVIYAVDASGTPEGQAALDAAIAAALGG